MKSEYEWRVWEALNDKVVLEWQWIRLRYSTMPRDVHEIVAVAGDRKESLSKTASDRPIKSSQRTAVELQASALLRGNSLCVCHQMGVAAKGIDVCREIKIIKFARALFLHPHGT